MQHNSLDGVYSHGVNRFPRVVEYLDKGEIDSGAIATCEIVAWEPLSAGTATGDSARSMQSWPWTGPCELAKEYGVGVVALGNNNHWMRGGSYGWQAADKGCIGICWSNTMPNMPAWGGRDRKIGNNPFIMSIPRSSGRTRCH